MFVEEFKFQWQKPELAPDDLGCLVRVNVATFNRWESGMSKTPRSVRLWILLARLYLKQRQQLCRAEGSQQWKNWPDRHLTSDITDKESSQGW